MSDESTKKDQKPATLADAANSNFQIDLSEPSAVVPAAAADAGGLTYASAKADERAKIDQIIATIDLTKPESVIARGKVEREKLATLADQVLDSVQPGVKLAFVEALKELIDAVKSHSLSEVKKALSGGALSHLWHAVTGQDNTKATEVSKKKIEKFMTTITDSRKIIREMTDKLQAQQVELDKNFGRINALGTQIIESAQDMRIERAATAEFIRRVEAGQITTLTDLDAKAADTKRADDMQAAQEAHVTWNNLRVVDGDLLGSIGIYDMNVANLAFTRQANMQNRMQTATTLTTTIAEWKTQLAIFATVMTEQAAAKLLDNAAALTEKSIKENKDLFDTLVDTVTLRSAKGTFNLRQIMEQQDAMAAKLEAVGPAIEKQFDQLAKDKVALAESSAKFRQRAATVYSKKGGPLSAP